ncbi:MAG: hypothetical protein GX575_05240 [Candidatus Anammoximicrobium sp.]|nr:hypothetical protein [Candidatus Anammoximicrobium sp.]
MKERLKILITVKTYPIPSGKYGELVCTAGLTEQGQFVRLYPINFRDQPYSKQYRKYQWVEIEAERHHGRDSRRESFRPDCDTLVILGEPIPTLRGDWSERARLVLQNVASSVEQLREQQDKNGTSLGIVRPRMVHDLVAEPTDREWKKSFLAELRQSRIWDDRPVSKQPPRKVPYNFKYVFDCDDPRCKGHRMMNEDWELGSLYWKMIDKGCAEEEAIAKVREKFLTQMCGPDRDPHFFLGTVLSHPKNWVVIGVFWPPAAKQRETDRRQLNLF